MCVLLGVLRLNPRPSYPPTMVTGFKHALHQKLKSYFKEEGGHEHKRRDTNRLSNLQLMYNDEKTNEINRKNGQKN